MTSLFFIYNFIIQFQLLESNQYINFTVEIKDFPAVIEIDFNYASRLQCQQDEIKYIHFNFAIFLESSSSIISFLIDATNTLIVSVLFFSNTVPKTSNSFAIFTDTFIESLFLGIFGNENDFKKYHNYSQMIPF